MGYNRGMKRPVLRHLLLLPAAAALAAIFGVCLHSLEEIHYLKHFFPPSFTVAETFYAVAIELIKVMIITFPLVLAIAVCLFVWRDRDR